MPEPSIWDSHKIRVVGAVDTQEFVYFYLLSKNLQYKTGTFLVHF